ncbi:MAG: hypothetical protein BWY66_00875 [bacterium ADurb.Bin374]|nr:MAG: hypothetical protein BWY66_00875 [bacterium ADurb.Bin374]
MSSASLKLTSRGFCGLITPPDMLALVISSLAAAALPMSVGITAAAAVCIGAFTAL